MLFIHTHFDKSTGLYHVILLCLQGQWYLDQMHGHGVLAHWAPEEGVVVYEVP